MDATETKTEARTEDRTEQPTAEAHQQKPEHPIWRRAADRGAKALAEGRKRIDGLAARVTRRGDRAMDDGKGLAKDYLATGRKHGRRVIETAGNHVERVVGRLRGAMGIPNRGDVEAMAKRIEEVEKKLHALGA